MVASVLWRCSAEGGRGRGIDSLRCALLGKGRGEALRRGEALGVTDREALGEDAREGVGEPARRRREFGVEPLKNLGVKARGSISRSALVVLMKLPTASMCSQLSRCCTTSLLMSVWLLCWLGCWLVCCCCCCFARSSSRAARRA